MTKISRSKKTLFLFVLIALAYAYYRTGGLRHIPEGSVGVVSKLDGSHNSKVFQPGFRAVIPFWERIEVLKVGPQTVLTLPIKGKTRDGFGIALRLSITYSRDENVDQLQTKQSEILAVIQSAAKNAVFDYAAQKESVDFALNQGSAEAETTIAEAIKTKVSQHGIKIIDVTVDHLWLDPKLDLFQKGLHSLQDLQRQWQDKACQGNPAC